MKYLILIFVFFLCGLVHGQATQKTLFIKAPEGTSRYAYLPFEIPRGTTSFTLTYEYDRKNGTNVFDLGLFDPDFDGSESSVRGFRGWSGGRRGTIFVSEDRATNGYLPGKIRAGTWRAILGIYKVAPEGVEVRVSVKLNEIEAKAEAERIAENAKTFEVSNVQRTRPVSQNGYNWYRGDLHTHTFHSDGNWTLKGILDYARASNLDFVGITEHNTTSHHAELTDLPGITANCSCSPGRKLRPMVGT